MPVLPTTNWQFADDFASLPNITEKLPVNCVLYPRPMLWLPVVKVLRQNAFLPIATFWHPVSLFCKAAWPKAILLFPVVLNCNDPLPKEILLQLPAVQRKAFEPIAILKLPDEL